MKKVLLFAILLVLLIPTLSLADMDVPMPILYKAYVSNPNGAEYYDDNGSKLGSLEFQTLIFCTYGYTEYERPEKVRFVTENEKFDSTSKYISASDITVNDLGKYELGDKEEVKVVKDTIIYDLPQDYTDNGNVLGTIPAGTDITIQKYSNISKETGLDVSSWSIWYYTSYNGINGWINANEENVGFAWKYINDLEYITARNLLSEKGIFVPMNTKINEYYYFVGGTGNGFFYYQGDVVRATRYYDIAHKDSETIHSYTILFEGIPLFEQANVNSKVIQDSLTSGETIVPEYEVSWNFPLYIKITNNGEEGWVYVEPLVSYDLIENKEDNLASNQDYVENLSNYYFESLEKQKSFEADKIIEKEDATQISTDIDETRTENDTPGISKDEENENPSVTPANEKTTYPVNNQFVEKKADDTSRVLIIALSAVIIFLTVIVIILLVNRKK